METMGRHNSHGGSIFQIKMGSSYKTLCKMKDFVNESYEVVCPDILAVHTKNIMKWMFIDVDTYVKDRLEAIDIIV